jgi:hypothetical protein
VIRPQYHFQPSPRGLLAWDVRRLVERSRDLPVRPVRVDAIAELDRDHWYAHGDVRPTPRNVVEHCRLIAEADLSFPIILGEDGRVMDGMHRVCRALLDGVEEIPAVRFERDPEPDHVGREPEDLPYE